MSLFPSWVRRGQAEREERMEQEGNGKKKGSHQLQRFNDNEEEREWGSRWMDRRKREGESAKIDRLSVIPRQSCVCMCVCVTWWSLETVCVYVYVYTYMYILLILGKCLKLF